MKHEFENEYPEKTIKGNPILSCRLTTYKSYISKSGAVSRHYESRRREYIDSQPNRKAAKEINIKNTKVRSRKRQVCQP